MLENIKNYITKLAIGVIVFFMVLIIIIVGSIYLYSYYQDNKMDNISKKAKHHTSEVVAYQFQGDKGTDLVKLKNGVQFESNNLSVGDSNFESKVPFCSNNIKKGKKITYFKKPNSNAAHPYYYIAEIE
ncbi:hypothetical protein [Staphylococcus saprophyticus]|uniref:hypothetical protein n=1 Tax=Staphylococcus saprophyticus TaxID=29385 RepID=UPI0034C67046